MCLYIYIYIYIYVSAEAAADFRAQASAASNALGSDSRTRHVHLLLRAERLSFRMGSNGQRECQVKRSGVSLYLGTESRRTLAPGAGQGERVRATEVRAYDDRALV